MGLLNKLNRKEKIKILKENLEIQINNNKILRENLRKEQAFSKSLEVGAKVIKEENEKLKKNIRAITKDNEELAKMLNELIVKYDVKLSTGEKPKAKRETKKKGE